MGLLSQSGGSSEDAVGVSCIRETMAEPLAQRVIPMLSYEDAGRAADWIAEAFGFRETGRWADEEGTVSHVNRCSPRPAADPRLPHLH